MQREDRNQKITRKHPKFNIDISKEETIIRKDYGAIREYLEDAKKQGKIIRNAIITANDVPGLHQPVLIGKQGEPVAFYENYILGKGGFSTIYFGVRMDSNDLCAVKVIDLNEERIKNKSAVEKEFYHEQEMLNQVGSLVDALETMEHGNLMLYCIQDLIWGANLIDFLDKKTGEKLSLQEELILCLSVVEAMKKLHDHGILHRDIKTDQVLWDEEHSKATMTDFGFAIKAENAKNLTEIVGSYIAVPPDLWKQVTKIENGHLYVEGGCRQDERTEIFGVGTILADILMESTPKDNATRFYEVCDFDNLVKQGNPEICSKVFRRAYQSLFDKTDSDEIRGRLINLTVRMLDENPNNRPTFNEAVYTLKMCKDALMPDEGNNSFENKGTSYNRP